MARKGASRQSDAGGHHVSDPEAGPAHEVEAVLAAARAEIGERGKGARRRLVRLERKLGAALRVEAKRRRKLGEALGEVAGLVARVREVVRPDQAERQTAPHEAAAGATDATAAPKRTAVMASAAPEASTATTTKAEPTAGAKSGARMKSGATAKPAPRRRAARGPTGPGEGSDS